MPLSPPVARELLHLRDIALKGYQREDGLFDIEAHLVDTKTYGFPSEHRGRVEPGEPLHGMWVRLTIDMDMNVIACEAASDFTPFAICPQAAPNFAALAGLKIGPGFNKAVQERVGGVKGCTHLRELLAQMATVAFQTLYPVRARREAEERRAASAAAAAGTVSGEPPASPGRRPALLDSCYAYRADGPVVARRWPEWARPPQPAEPQPADPAVSSAGAAAKV
ncbi:MAG: DUF2889 domain-containing protein [Rhodovarius sp.]|nr:DUF2889 domain-containing protein [Rhodovarius sp.]MDW8315878.1 DUF2889 domain-containing protein [Rhodovarius sp.]